MIGLELSPESQLWTNIVLLWIGFGALVGLLVRVILPFREPSGAFITLVIGMASSCVGPYLAVMLFDWNLNTFNPISLKGLGAAIVSGIVLLIMIRLGLYMGSFISLKKKQRQTGVHSGHTP